MNRTRGQMFALLSLVAAAAVPLLFLMIRLRMFTFRDDYYGWNALAFFMTWALGLILAGSVLGGLAWRADRGSWLVRSAVGINGALVAGIVWMLVTLIW